MMVKLFIVGFPRDMAENDLIEIFSAHGQVAALNVARDRQNGRNLGYAFVEMSDEAGAVRAVQALNGAPISGRTLHVRFRDSRPAFEIADAVRKPLLEKKKRPRRVI